MTTCMINYSTMVNFLNSNSESNGVIDYELILTNKMITGYIENQSIIATGYIENQSLIAT